jgi:hypothetical protein
MVDAMLARECSVGNDTLMVWELSPGLWTNLSGTRQTDQQQTCVHAISDGLRKRTASRGSQGLAFISLLLPNLVGLGQWVSRTVLQTNWTLTLKPDV